MAGITDALTRKLGPAPVWLWLAAGGVGIFLISRSGLLRGVTGQPATPSQQQPAAVPAESASAGAQLQQEIGLLQQLQAFQQQSYQNNLQQVQQTQGLQNQLSPGAPAAPPPAWQFGQPPAGQDFVWQFSPQGRSNIAQQGIQLPTSGIFAGPNVVGPASGPYGWEWAQVPPGYTPASYAAALNQSGAAATSAGARPNPPGVLGLDSRAGGRGGPRIPSQLHALTGRPTLGIAHPIWRSGHPLLRAGAAGPLYPHYAMAGPRHVLQIGGATGVHPARVLALNAGIRRGHASPGQRVRVA